MNQPGFPATIRGLLPVSLFLYCLIPACHPPGSPADRSPGDGFLYKYDPNSATRWSSPENPSAEKGGGAKENGTAKGRAFVSLAPGASALLLDTRGPGIIQRIWITVRDRSPRMLRSLRVEMFWDGEDKPAVSAPLGDFFGLGLGRTLPFTNALFSSPEGRSFLCFIPMPFRTEARIVVTNDSEQPLTHLFYDVDFQLLSGWDPGNLYFHAYWHRDTATQVGKDFELLPAVRGHGRFLGVNADIHANLLYGESWWGEGEVKMYLDGDKSYPTLAGTGTEDYIGTGWGQGIFSTPFSGCLVADVPKKQWAFYRYHIPDPVYFGSAIRVTLQQIGGDEKQKVLAWQKANLPLVPVSIDHEGNLELLYKDKKPLDFAGLPDGWTNFYRSDDLSATAYFYLDSPGSDLPPIQPVAIRTWKMETQ